MTDQQILIYKGKVCPYCFKGTQYVNSSLVYNGNTKYGMVYWCKPCKAWVGVHRKTSQKALGRLANSQLRILKTDAHYFFDYLWKHKKETRGMDTKEARGASYKWLSEQMKIDIEFTHIGMFDEKQCNQVINLCQPIVAKIESKKNK